MAHRKEVFQSKVFQRLYPAGPKLEKEASPPRMVEAVAKKTFVKRKASQEYTVAGNAGQMQSTANPCRRMYTVLPPPADYKTHAEKSVTLPQLDSINSAKDPAESVHESNEELDQDEVQEEQKRKRRTRKRKKTPHQESGQGDAAAGSESSTGQSQTAGHEGGEHISRNKKRKLKKKRHKEKLLSMGAVPRAAALEFTYQKDGEDEEAEEEDDERRAAEVSDFLRTTLEIYMSDSSPRVDNPPLLSGTVDDLLSHVSSGCKPNSVLKQLYSLKAYVQRKETEKLEKALKELYNSSCMSAGEAAAVVSLFQYWITDILPMQRDENTGLSTTHPRDCQSR
ncbi:glutamate-rich protein 1 isoform X2 [Seriola dumerili]|uniref:glutamate-rich protein 1 isoform X2 n=1 Tax=Seriola dumerili TaxID=41447 RepID=UPI000BBF2BEA|nr:glutamate-rich protein 1 isoform X2 [Seriola dumerili]